MKEKTGLKDSSQMEGPFYIDDDLEDDYFPCTDVNEWMIVKPDEKFLIIGQNSGIRNSIFEGSYKECLDLLHEILNGFDENGIPMADNGFNIVSVEEWETLK